MVKKTKEAPLLFYFCNYYLKRDISFWSKNKLYKIRKWEINHAKHPKNY